MDSPSRFEDSVISLWTTHSVSQIAAELKTSVGVVYRAAKARGLKSHKELAEEKPSPEEIAARAAMIRDGWSDSERRQREVGRCRGYSFPQVTSRQLFPAFQGDLR